MTDDLATLFRKLAKLEGEVERLKTGERNVAQNHGYISSAWQKDPLRIGYSGDVSEVISNVNAAAGTNILNSTAVPAGEIWVVQAVDALDVNTGPTRITLYITRGSVVTWLYSQATPGAGIPTYWTGEIVLSEGDTISASLEGCTLNDDLAMRYSGYRVDIDQ